MSQLYQTDHQRVRIIRRRLEWLSKEGRRPGLSKNARAKNAMEAEALTFVLGQWERLTDESGPVPQLRRAIIGEDEGPVRPGRRLAEPDRSASRDD